MRGRAILTVLALIAPSGFSSAPAAPGVSAFRTPVPFGSVGLLIACTIRPAGGQGSWVAAFSVDAFNGLTESSVMALGWWNAGRAETTVRAFGLSASATPVDVEALPDGGFRVTVAANWGGAHRTWASTLRGGCGATDGTISDVSGVLNDARVEATAAARIVTAGANETGGTAVGSPIATVASGTTTIEAGYLLGVFSARAGRIVETLPDGTVREDSGMEPSIGVRGGFGGVFRFTSDTAVSDDPYLLTALAFDAA